MANPSQLKPDSIQLNVVLGERFESGLDSSILGIKFSCSDEEAQHFETEDTSLDFAIDVELTHKYSYIEDDSIPYLNELNNHIKENVLIWDVNAKPVKFNLPKTMTPESELTPEKAIITPKNVSLSQNEKIFLNAIPHQKKLDKILSTGENDIENQLKKPIAYQHVYDRLNSQQISSIWNTGKFLIHYEDSQTEEWQLRPWIIFGKQKCYQILKSHFEYLKFHLNKMKEGIYEKQVLDYLLKGPEQPWDLTEVHKFNLPNILNGLLQIIWFPIQIFILFIGIPKYEYNQYEFKQRILEGLSLRITNKIRCDKASLANHTSFLMHLNDNKDHYISLRQFEISGATELLNLTKSIHDGTLKIELPHEKKDSIQRILQDYIYDGVIEKVKHFLAEQNISKEIISSFESIYRSQIAMHRLYYMLVDQEVRPEAKESLALNYLNNAKCMCQHELLSLIINELSPRNIKELRNQIRKQVRLPNIISMVQIFNPSILVERVEQNGEWIYVGKQFHDIDIPTSFFGWRIALFFGQMLIWIRNLTVLFYLSMTLMFKVSFSEQEFSMQFVVNPMTGEVTRDNRDKIRTITSLYRKIRTKMIENIEKFEEQPDHGLIGKSFSRVFNRIENWCFWYFFVGFLCINIVLRIFSILATILCFILIPCSVVLAPIGVVSGTVFSLLIIDITTPKYETEWNLPRLFPIFNLLIWRLIVQGLGQIIASIALLVFHFTVGVITILSAVIIFVVRKAIDAVMISIVSWRGRVPGGDSYLAWRTKQDLDEKAAIDQSLRNPRINNSQIQLSFEQLCKMIDAEFDRFVLNTYQMTIIRKINEPMLENERFIRKIFSKLLRQNQSILVQEQYTSSAVKMVESLDKQVRYRIKCLPQLEKTKVKNHFKYTESELNQLFSEALEYIRIKYGKNKLFQQEMEKRFKCQQFDYNAQCISMFNIIFFDGKKQNDQVLHKLKYTEPRAEAYQINKEINKFLCGSFGIKIDDLKQPLQFLQFSQFIQQVTDHQTQVNNALDIQQYEKIDFRKLILLNTLSKQLEMQQIQ